MEKKRSLLNMKRRMNLKSQMEVADALGISQGGYSNIENGYANPTKEQAEALIAMFDLPKDYFDGSEEESDGKE